MRVLLDYKCGSCGETFESFRDPDLQEIPCKFCTGPARKLIPAPRMSMRLGVDLSFPTMAAKWDKMHNQQFKLEKERDS